MSTYYDLYETPDVQNTGEKQPLHARIVPSGTYSKKDFIERVSRHQPFPHNIIEGVLGAVVDELAEALADGYIVELGELGHFSISLKCTHKVMTKKEIRAESIRFDNVHLRTSKEFKKKIKREIELERVENSKVKTHDTKISIEDRLQMLQEFLKKNLQALYSSAESSGISPASVYSQNRADFEKAYPDWNIQEEQLLVYWIYTYFCGAVYDGEIFAKVKMAVVCTLLIHELDMGAYLKNGRVFCLEDQIDICYRFSRELEHSDLNLNAFEDLLAADKLFALENMLKIC